MKRVAFGGKSYEVDEQGFLTDHDQWDEDFAQATARKMKLGKLTEEHYQVLRFIRESFRKNGTCPLVYETGKANGLGMADLKRLFPDGYLRGACRLAGITYDDRFVNYFGEESRREPKDRPKPPRDKTYRLDVQGFLVDPDEWDERFAMSRAHEMKVGRLTQDHWKVIKHLRMTFIRKHRVPTVYETCEACGIELDGLERLFPDGYQRGAVKISGLRVR